jgi:ribonuclease D
MVDNATSAGINDVPMASYKLVQTDSELRDLIQHLRATGCTRLAVDVEGENNLHSYGIHVALIQLYDGTRGFVVDALGIADRSLLKELMEEPSWVKVWFDAANDLLSFQHALGIRPAPILDLAIAARLLGKQGGLGSMTDTGRSASAKDRFQKANWMRRPISAAMLDYAFSDVTPLLEMADRFMAEIEAAGKVEEFRARNHAQESIERTWNPLANFTRIPGYGSLKRPERRLAKILWYAREYHGRRTDLPPGNVASRQELRAIVDRGLRDPVSIARFLNENRKRNRIDPGAFAERFREAERDVDEEEAAAAGSGRR